MPSQYSNILDQEFSTRDNALPFNGYLLLGLGIFLACVCLVWVDQDTQSWRDVFSLRLVPALLIYGLPTYAWSIIFYKKIRPSTAYYSSLLLALILGVVVAFAGMMMIIFAFTALLT